MTSPLTIKAHAKLNLNLSVGQPVPEGERKGWHPLESLFACIELHDKVTVEPAETTTYDIHWADGTPVDWPIERDLAARAHRALEQHTNRELPARITVEKHVPAGGGLGGGSSDAAAVIAALINTHNLNLTEQELIDLGMTLGSDVPYFLDPRWIRRTADFPRPALVTGFGESITRIEKANTIARCTAVLILPPFGCSTPEVFKAFDELNPNAGLSDVRGMLKDLAIGDLPRWALANDLARAAEHIEPRLRTIRRRVEERLGMPLLMTGSGSTLFYIGRGGKPGALGKIVQRELGADARVIESRPLP